MARAKVRAAALEPVEGPWLLPDGWRWERLQSIGKWGSGGTPKAKKLEYYGGGIPWYKIGDLNDGILQEPQDRITELGLKSSSAKLVPSNTILIAMYGSIGKLGITSRVCATNQAIAFCIPDPSVLDLRYFFHYLKSRREHLLSLGQGGTQQNISQTLLLDEAIPLPALETQRAIAARIDALFTEVEDGEAALGRARADLGTWRKALLKAAVTGELTADWRADRMNAEGPPPETGTDLLARILTERRTRWHAEPRNTGKRYVEPAEPDIDALAQLPEGWTWTAVGTAGDVLLGRQRAPEHHRGDHMRPYLRVANVMEDRLDLRDVKQMNFTPAEYLTFSLRPGDVLLNEGQAPDLLGRPAIYRGEIDGCCFQKTLLRFRPTPVVLPEFALIVFRRYMHGKRFLRESRITTNIGHLTQVRFLPMEFPLPPLDEQREITARVAIAEEAWDHHALDANVAATLRQSIFAAAFRGALTV